MSRYKSRAALCGMPDESAGSKISRNNIYTVLRFRVGLCQNTHVGHKIRFLASFRQDSRNANVPPTPDSNEIRVVKHCYDPPFSGRERHLVRGERFLVLCMNLNSVKNGNLRSHF
ncbi:hypothetical protein TNCV_4124861 [Trichonephila clavipes]|nr:hypothetical protein TNCV_4124861 [Trichonephila clavipes]